MKINIYLLIIAILLSIGLGFITSKWLDGDIKLYGGKSKEEIQKLEDDISNREKEIKILISELDGLYLNQQILKDSIEYIREGIGVIYNSLPPHPISKKYSSEISFDSLTDKLNTVINEYKLRQLK